MLKPKTGKKGLPPMPGYPEGRALDFYLLRAWLGAAHHRPISVAMHAFYYVVLERIEIELHGYVVLTLNDCSTLTIMSNGYRHRFVRDYINRLLPEGFKISSRKSRNTLTEWYLVDADGVTHEYFDGIGINHKGEVINP